jgi:hypothetical protein
MIEIRIMGGGSNSSNKAKKEHYKAALLFALSSLIYVFGFSIFSKSSVQAQSPTEPLAVKIKVESRQVCRGTALSVYAEIINNSTESLAIDPTFLWSRLSFTSSNKGKSGVYGSRTRTEVGDPDPFQDEPNYLVLRPGETFNETKELSLKDGFFEPLGKYTIRIKYVQFRDGRVKEVALFNGTVTSNEIEFEIATCGKRRKNL